LEKQADAIYESAQLKADAEFVNASPSEQVVQREIIMLHGDRISSDGMDSVIGLNFMPSSFFSPVRGYKSGTFGGAIAGHTSAIAGTLPSKKVKERIKKIQGEDHSDLGEYFSAIQSHVPIQLPSGYLESNIGYGFAPNDMWESFKVGALRYGNVSGGVIRDDHVTKDPDAFQMLVYVSKTVSDMWKIFFENFIAKGAPLTFTFKPNTFATVGEPGKEKTYNCVTFAIESGLDFCSSALNKRLSVDISTLPTGASDMRQISVLQDLLLRRREHISNNLGGGTKGKLQGNMMKLVKEENKNSFF
jgi:hypothetical protein